jgi:rhodanese-related sulfurtransferase
VKIFHDGLPEWNKRNFTVLPAQYLKEAWLDKDLSFVLLDVRTEKEAAAGFIKGAVNTPEKDFDKALKSFPSKDLKPPIVVYDATGDGTAEKVAMKLVKAGYPGPRVLTGGFAAWQTAKYALETGKPATKVAYVPKPKAGSIAIADFEAFAKGVPANVQILDVRNKEEVEETGIIKGALNIPADLVAERLAEIPKDKELVMHCSTGARAEMAYNILKEKGYKVRFLDATIANYEDGTFKIEK